MNRRIRLLIVTHTLDQGGLEEIVRLYACLLDKSKFEVTIAYMVGGRISEEMQRDESIRMVWIQTKSRPARLLQLVRLARRLDIDILHNHLSWYGLLAGFFAGARRVETIHNTYTWLTGTKRLAFGLLSLLAHRLIAVSHVVKDFTHQYFPLIAHSKLIVIHNGIHADSFRTPTNADELRMKFGFSTSDFLVTFVGRLEEPKGVAYLLEAAFQLQQRNTKIKFVIVGEGSLETRLREQARALGLTHVFFLGYQSDVAELLAASDVFALPSVYEGLPLTLLQAMAVGVPSVASRVGGVPEVIQDGVNGFLVDPRSVEQLSLRIEQLYNDPGLRESFRRNGQKTVREKFGADVMVRKTEDLYHELVAVRLTWIWPS